MSQKLRNRAKCKLCKSIIESFHRYDYVACKCGEIAVDGGLDYLRVIAKDYANFLRIDENGNEIQLKVIDKTESDSEQVIDGAHEGSEELGGPGKITREQKMQMLRDMVSKYEELPQQAMNLPISHYDLYSFMLLVSSLFEEV